MYLCHGDYNSAGRYCIGFGGMAAEQRIVDEVLKLISPEGIAASLRAVEQLECHRSDHRNALQRQLQQVEYEAQRAFV